MEIFFLVYVNVKCLYVNLYIYLTMSSVIHLFVNIPVKFSGIMRKSKLAQVIFLSLTIPIILEVGIFFILFTTSLGCLWWMV